MWDMKKKVIYPVGNYFLSFIFNKTFQEDRIKFKIGVDEIKSYIEKSRLRGFGHRMCE